MHEVQKHILRLFHNHDTLSTSQIVRYIYAQVHEEYTKTLEDPHAGSEAKEQAHQLKSKLHRRILHHINTLIAQHRLTITDTGPKGEKVYGVMHIESPHVKAMQTSSPTLPLEGYESRNVVFRYKADTWTSKMNAFLVHGQKCSSPKHLYDNIQLLFQVTNDVVIVNDMEHIVQQHDLEDVMEVCIRLEAQCKDFDQRLCFIFDMTNVEDERRILLFLKTVVPLGSDTVSYVFDTTGREMMHHSDFFEHLITLFSRYNIKCNIKNDELHQAPLGVGRAGTYTFDERAWKEFCTKRYDKAPPIMACSHSSVIVDVKKCFDEYHTAQAFVKLIDQVAKSLFVASTAQRRHAEQYFAQMYDQDLYGELFTLHSATIRLWNYDFENYHLDRQTILDLIKQAQARLKEFSATQQTIYLSCGMPIQFNVGLSCAYRKFNKDELVLFEAFDKVELHNINEIYSKRFRETLLFKEQIASQFEYGDEMRFYRRGTVDPVDIVREFQALLHTYKFPFFCYKFEHSAQHTVTLQNFLE